MPSEGPRQRPPEFDQVFALLKSLQIEFLQSSGPHPYSTKIDTIRYCSAAKSDDAIREQEYPGWENEDLQDLLLALGE